ncbi:GntR family transcriptional regulator, partial [Siminovitchia fortis]|uniref:GntR family transcriptional regulator n=1 Tax=Siminovitchia fortis TaxID=254758 RepID=UPI0011A1781A
MKIDYNHRIAVHMEVKDVIEEDMVDGIYSEEIGREGELMEKFKVRGSTVGEGMKLLVREGIVEKKDGKGRFVCLKGMQ